MRRCWRCGIRTHSLLPSGNELFKIELRLPSTSSMNYVRLGGAAKAPSTDDIGGERYVGLIYGLVELLPVKVRLGG